MRVYQLLTAQAFYIEAFSYIRGMADSRAHRYCLTPLLESTRLRSLMRGRSALLEPQIRTPRRERRPHGQATPTRTFRCARRKPTRVFSARDIAAISWPPSGVVTPSQRASYYYYTARHAVSEMLRLLRRPLDAACQSPPRLFDA